MGKPRGPGLLLALFLPLACRVHYEGDPEPGPGLLEILGAEVDNLGFELRELRRSRGRLLRGIQASRRERLRLEAESRKASREKGRARKELAEALTRLKFLEESMAASEARGKEIRAALEAIDRNETRLKEVEARGKALPDLIGKAGRAKAAEEKRLGELQKDLAELLKKMASFEKELGKAASRASGKETGPAGGEGRKEPAGQPEAPPKKDGKGASQKE